MAEIELIIPAGKYENIDATENVIKYALRLGDMSLVGGYGVMLTNAEDIADQFYTVKKIFNKTEGKQVIHFIFSVDKSCFLKPEHVRRLGYMLGEFFGNERQVVFGVHNDTEHLHIHMVVNTIAYTNGTYCGYFDIGQLRNHMRRCADCIMDEVWFGKMSSLTLA